MLKHLVTLKGIWLWTLEMLLIFAMERPDVVSWGDAAIGGYDASLPQTDPRSGDLPPDPEPVLPLRVRFIPVSPGNRSPVNPGSG